MKALASVIASKSRVRKEHVKIATIILCAGVGSRLKSSKSKLLHEVCGRAVAYWPIKHALSQSDVKPIVVVGHQADAIEAKLAGYFGDALRFAYQESPNGTGGAVKAAMPLLDDTCDSVLILCGDTPLLREESLARLLMIQRNSHVPIAMLSAVAPDPFGYGRVIRNGAQQIISIIEEHEATPLEREIREVNPAVYVFDRKFLRDHIDTLKEGARRKELYLTDLVRSYVSAGAPHGPVSSIEIAYEEMHGVNDRRQLAYAQKALNRRLIDNWMQQGVTFIDPDTTYVEEGVSLSQDVTIYPGVHMRGQTHIGEGSVVENGCILNDTVLENNVHLLPYTWCDAAVVGERCQLGPFARLRAGSYLESDVKIGNFVEVKKTRVKKGAKANHLAYLGDAQLGEYCNIGAGTITCNYDGKTKHQTIIGDKAFIGSNATLIAPLTIGDGAYVAGGSTINQDIPAGALAVGRARQANKIRRRAPSSPSGLPAV